MEACLKDTFCRGKTGVRQKINVVFYLVSFGCFVRFGELKD